MRSARRAVVPGRAARLGTLPSTPPVERHQRISRHLAQGPVVINGTMLAASCRRLVAGERSRFATEEGVS
jgi:hypothetical protein